MKHFSFFLFILALAGPAFATSTQPAFDALKTKAVDYGPTGQICEQVARLELAEKYLPAQYDIAVGVEYAVAGRTIGELDIVIVDKRSNAVELVGEVKCWKSVSGGLAKARKQRARFLRTLSSRPDQIVFKAKEGGAFSSNQFQRSTFIAIAQNGAKTEGFDMELTYTLRELMDLRGQLLDCQSQGKCAIP